MFSEMRGNDQFTEEERMYLKGIWKCSELTSDDQRVRTSRRDGEARLRGTEEDHIEELDRLTRLLYELLSEGLGLHPLYLSDFFQEQDQQVMVVNFYPPCPLPELTMGIHQHCDIGLVTILWQDSTSGLEISKDRNWIPVKAVEDAFVIDMRDQIEIFFCSMEHGGLVNSFEPHMSVATFTAPRDNVLIAPIPGLMLSELKTPQYNEVAFGIYKTSFFT